jgi:hypothetical protein
MSVDEAVVRIAELRGRVNSGLSSMEKAEVARLYGEVLGKVFKPTTCRDCYRDACIEMELYLRKNGAMKEKSRYVLLNGVIIREFGTGKVYSNANLTDKVAQAWLKKYPQQIKMFAAYPDDWKVRCGLERKPKKEEAV